jgi:hypothetical protein
VRTLNFKFGYRLKMGGTRHAQLGLNIFNALNSGPLHGMAPVRRKPVVRPELLPGSGQPADVAVGAVRRGIPVLIRNKEKSCAHEV